MIKLFNAGTRPSARFARVGGAALWLSFAAGLAVTSYAHAQEPPPAAPKEPEPEKPVGLPPVTDQVYTRPGATTDLTRPVEGDGSKYLVSRFVLAYAFQEAEGQPDLTDEGFQRLTVRLGQTDSGYVLPRPGVPTVDVRLADITEGAGGFFYQSAIEEVCRAVVREFNRRGIYALFVAPSEKDIDERPPYKDLREGRTSLALSIYVGTVRTVRTVAGGDRDLGDPAINNPGHERVLRLSPVKPGAVLRKDRLDDFAYRLNRHPGRRVDVAVSADDEQGGVLVDYLVTENKPWTLYFNISNTGTKNTSEWRESVGFVHNQLTGNDDILRLDYSTAGGESHAITPSYEFPLAGLSLRARLFGTYSEYTASDVGINEVEFNGKSYTAGGELIYTAWQDREWFLDLIGGFKYERVEVESTTGTDGSEDFMIPSIGVVLERNSDVSHTMAYATFDFSVGGGDQAELDQLGRTEAEGSFTMLKWGAEQSFYIEPTFEIGTTLAHELSAKFGSQIVLGDSRVIPYYESTLGGAYTVRGYPESVVAGDNSYIANFEYRFHLPQIFEKSAPGTLFGREFRYVPQGPYGRADWDLIMKGFFDIGFVETNDPLSFEADSETLMGAGVGLELQFLRNVNFKVDWGVALKDINDDPTTGGQFVSSGSSRFHIGATILY